MRWQNPENRNMGVITLAYWADALQQFCPTGASTVPMMGKHVTPLGHVCCTDVAHFSPILQTLFVPLFETETDLVLLFTTKLQKPVLLGKGVCQHSQIQINP